MGLFLDLINLSEAATDGALEYIYKAHHDHGDDGIWKPHESILIKRLVEMFTKRGLDRLDAVHQQFLAWEAGAHHTPSASPVPAPPGNMQRWTPSELALARLYLESLPPALWTLGDHMLAIEFVIQTYLPVDALVAEADWLATKATMMGKVQANLQEKPTAKQADAILAAMPSSIADSAPMSSVAHAVLMFSRARVAENVRAISESVRHRMRAVVTADLEQKAFGAIPAGTSSLQTKLADEFAVLNRDWRRIAVTEAGEAQLQGYIATLKPGAQVKRVERYDNACSFCKKIDGKVVTVVAPDHPDKNPDTMIWPGKNNIGRSASPRKRVGDVLVHREPHEMWTIPAGLVHPHCRGRWLAVAADDAGDDAEFSAMLRGILTSSETAPESHPPIS